MGTDIHAFAEWTCESFDENENSIWSVTAGSFNLTRDYELFTLIADVRRSLPDQTCLFLPRGIPMSLSEDVFRAYYELAGVDEPEDNYGFNWHNEDGLLDVIEDFQGDPPFGPPNGTRYIAGINWHNPSWLNSSEVKQALDAHHDVDFEWTLLWNCLQSLDEQYGDRHSRLVFWFDS